MEFAALDRASTTPESISTRNTRNSKRLSSGRSFKPRQNFSPEPTNKKSERAFVIAGRRQRDASSSSVQPAYLDQMTRCEQFCQLECILPSDFRLPSSYMSERSANQVADESEFIAELDADDSSESFKLDCVDQEVLAKYEAQFSGVSFIFLFLQFALMVREK